MEHDDVGSAPERRGRSAQPAGRARGGRAGGPAPGTPGRVSPRPRSSSVLGFGEGVVGALGVRLIGLDRPGLGASDPAPGRTLEDWAGDVRSFVRARDLGRPRMVGFSQGAPFALACAAAGIVRAVAIVSGGDELAAPTLADALVPDVRRLVELATRDPEGAEAMFRTMSAGAMHGMVSAMSGPEDRAVYARPAFDAAYRRALDEGFAQGAEGYARDTLLAMRAWPFDLARIAVPVLLWYGAADASPVHSPDLGASLERRIPGARRRVVAGAGGALLWTHAREILEALLAA